jgi:hypothetical protein
MIDALKECGYSSLRSYCANLRVLRLWYINSRTEPDEEDLEIVVSSLITASVLLEKVIVSIPISNSDLLHLGSCAHLYQLNVCMFQTPHTSISRSETFRYLEITDITDMTGNLNLANFILSSEPHDRLTTLRCEAIFNRTSSILQLERFIDHVSRWTSLVKLTIILPSAYWDVFSIETYRAIFKAFQNLSTLEELKWQSDFPVLIDENIIRGMLDACPRLRTWTLRGSPDPNLIMPFLSFIDFLRRYPQISSLPIDVRCSVKCLPCNVDGLRGFAHQSYGERLSVRDVDCDPEALATLISKTLPRVKFIGCEIATLGGNLQAAYAQADKIQKVNRLLNA